MEYSQAVQDFKIKNTKYVDDASWKKVNADSKSIFNFYIEHQKGISKSSLRQYQNNIKIFLVWILKYKGNVVFTEMNTRDMLEYQAWLIKEGNTLKTIRYKRCALSKFFEFVIRHYKAEYPDFKNLIDYVDEPDYIETKTKPYITIKEMNVIREQLQLEGRYKELAYAELMFSQGLKAHEVLGLKRDIVEAIPNANQKYPVMVNGKKRMLNLTCMTALRQYMDTRKDNNEWLFPSNDPTNGKPLDPTTFNYWCDRHYSYILHRPIKPSYFYDRQLAKEEEKKSKDKRRIYKRHYQRQYRKQKRKEQLKLEKSLLPKF